MTEENLFFGNSDIETIFKVVPPLEAVEDGHGYYGVVLRNKVEDKLQCHICGKWWSMLSNHITRGHKHNLVDYKKKYGLPLGFPLVSKAISAAHRESSLKHKRGFQLDPKSMKAGAKKAHKMNKSISIEYGRSCSAFANKNGLCEEQMLRRFLVVADILCRVPMITDLIKYDNALLAAIKFRYKRINNFRKHHGLALGVDRQEITESKCVARIREYAHKYGRAPGYNDFKKGSPSAGAIARFFGSWNRALISAGFDISRNTPYLGVGK